MARGKNKELDDALGLVFVESIDLQSYLLQTAIELGKPLLYVDEAIVKIVRMKIDVVPGLFEYALDTVPLAKDKGVYEWAYDSVAMYRQPVIEMMENKKKEKDGN